jgi:DNA polymerase-3 subunit beta
MNFTTTRTDLLPAITALTRIVSPRPIHPTLGGILCIAEDGELRLSATDLELSLTMTIPAEVSEPSCTVLPANLTKLIQKYSAEQIIVTGDDQIQVECGKSKSKMGSMSPQEYPELPTIAGMHSISLEGTQWKSWMRKLAISAANVNARPEYAGVRIKSAYGKLILTSFDGYRFTEIKVDLECEEIDTIIPIRFIEESIKLVDGKVTLWWNDTTVALQGDTFTFTGRPIASQFINYERSIPAGDGITVTIPRKEFMFALDRCQMFNQSPGAKQKPIVSLSAAGNMLNLQAQDETGGENFEGITIDPVEIETTLFTCEYLSDPLKVIDGEAVELHLYGNRGAAIYREENVLYFVAPIIQRTN